MPKKKRRFVVVRGISCSWQIRDMDSDGFYKDSGFYVADFSRYSFRQRDVQKIADELERKYRREQG